jgi:hypothetical protein
MARRKQCKEKGCRKGRAEGSEYCAVHMTVAEPSAPAEPQEVKGGNGVGSDPVFAEDNVQKLTEAELDKFNLLRLKVERNLQQIRILELEQERADREYVAEKHNRETHLNTLRGLNDPLNTEYLAHVRRIATKYKIHPDFLGINDDTGVLQDLRPIQEEVEPG